MKTFLLACTLLVISSLVCAQKTDNNTSSTETTQSAVSHSGNDKALKDLDSDDALKKELGAILSYNFSGNARGWKN